MSNVLHCDRCDKLGHASHECPSYPLARGEIEGATNHPDSGWGDNVQHISQISIRIVANGVEQKAARREPYWYQKKILDIQLGNKSYHLGSASGDGCNCLIDTLRQVILGIMCNVAGVRAKLENRHHAWRTNITPGD